MQIEKQPPIPIDLDEAPAIGHWWDANYADYAARHAAARRKQELVEPAIDPRETPIRPAHEERAAAAPDALAKGGNLWPALKLARMGLLP